MGDHIPERTYTRYSQFDKAVNFIAGTRLVSIVSKSIGAGPNNLVIEYPGFHQINTLEITRNEIYINGDAFSREALPVFHSALIKLPVSDDISSLPIVGNILIRGANPKSLAFLLDPAREKYFTSGFEREFVKKIKTGVQKLSGGKIFESVATLKGAGVGLTPAGDDFICGMLYALFIKQPMNPGTSELREQIYLSATGENLLSNSFLYFAKEGCFYEDFKNLVESLAGASTSEIEKYTRAVLQNGETSGADMLAGFLKILNYEPTII